MRVKIFFATVRAVNNGRYSLILVSDHRGNWGEDFEANLKSCNDSPLYCICKHRHTSTHVLTGTWKIMGADRVRLSDIFLQCPREFLMTFGRLILGAGSQCIPVNRFMVEIPNSMKRIATITISLWAPSSDIFMMFW